MKQPLSPLHAMLEKIGRERHAKRINRIINDPSVLPWVQGHTKAPLDISPAIADPNNVLLMGQHGGIVFHKHQPGIYEAHTQVLPGGRGEWTVMMVRAALHWMFCRTDAIEILTRCPKGNLGARALAKAIGGKFEFRNPRGWAYNGETIFADIFALRIQDWMREAPGLEERGHWFHERLEREYAKLGVTEPLHDDDPVHDRYVGAACEMILGRNPQKGVIFYNRWAALADYAPIEIVSLKPVAINIRDAILVIREDGDFYVMSVSGDLPKESAVH